MKATIDSAGRILIPKPLRERLGLAGGEQVQLVERGGRIEINALPTRISLVERQGGPVAVPDGKLPPLTDEIVRATLEQVRR